ncbi:hypothetical protein VKT23_019040 [Stygiomarasmius scandens]|uniref:Uncharacterized protein n=1 Tax=Marasmiellus scandens TaxID=2682957 RepID=A0ABR1IQH8_9AGAR
MGRHKCKFPILGPIVTWTLRATTGCDGWRLPVQHKRYRPHGTRRAKVWAAQTVDASAQS